MNHVKRWAFVPLLLLGCLLVADHVVGPHGSLPVAVAFALVLAVVVGYYWDRARQRRRP